MEDSSKIKELLGSITDYLNEKVWFQELKTKWEELDPQSRSYLRFALFGGGVLGVMLLILTSIWSVHSLKKELSDRRSLLFTIQSANEEMRKLKESTPHLSASGGFQTPGNFDTDPQGGPWTPYFESLALGSGVDKSSLTVGSEKPGTSTEQSKESLFDVSLKHVNIKQVVRYAFAIENGQRPVKLRNLSIDTTEGASGYLDTTLAISAFTPTVPK